MEATGVYGQALAYFLVAHNYRVAVEPPLKVKRAFPTHGHKNELRSLIKEIDKQIKSLMGQHPFFKHRFELLLSIPGVGLQLASYLLVITGNREPRANDIAAYVGICPYEHTSGTTVRRRPRSRKNGPGSIRMLLYL